MSIELDCRGVTTSKVVRQGSGLQLYRLGTAQLQRDSIHMVGYGIEDIFILGLNTVWKHRCFRI